VTVAADVRRRTVAGTLEKTRLLSRRLRAHVLIPFCAGRGTGALFWGGEPLARGARRVGSSRIYCVATLFYFLACSLPPARRPEFAVATRRRMVVLASGVLCLSLFTYPIALGVWSCSCDSMSRVEALAGDGAGMGDARERGVWTVKLFFWFPWRSCSRLISRRA